MSEAEIYDILLSETASDSQRANATRELDRIMITETLQTAYMG